MRYLEVVGIDEVGRGPIAGPLAVGAFLARRKVLKRYFRNIRDSKKLKVWERERWFVKINALEKRGEVDFAVTFVTVPVLDRIGLSKSLLRAISSCLYKLEINPLKTRVLLDGALRAPSRFFLQETVIGGDESEPLIALASIVAKVLRDRRMIRLAKRFPEYKLEKHKGYGTAEHYACIKKYGLCELHRRSFLKKSL